MLSSVPLHPLTIFLPHSLLRFLYLHLSLYLSALPLSILPPPIFPFSFFFFIFAVFLFSSFFPFFHPPSLIHFSLFHAFFFSSFYSSPPFNTYLFLGLILSRKQVLRWKQARVLLEQSSEEGSIEKGLVCIVTPPFTTDLVLGGRVREVKKKEKKKEK